jgi:hypothetical protein
MAHIQQSGTPVNLSSSGAVSLVAGSLIGFYVNSTTSGTVVIRNGTSTGTAISGTITPAIGFHVFPAYTPAGCYATLANTINATFFFAAG